MLLTSDNKSDQPSGWRCHSIVHNALVSTSLGQFGMVNSKTTCGSLRHLLHVIQALVLLLFSLKAQNTGDGPQVWPQLHYHPNWVSPVPLFSQTQSPSVDLAKKKFPHPSIHSPSHPSIYLCIQSFIHGPIHSSTNPENYSLIHLSNHSCSERFIYPSTHVFNHPSPGQFIHLSIYVPFIHLCIHPFIHLPSTYPHFHLSTHPPLLLTHTCTYP